VDFVFTLHSHLPYVLNHGRWPHGSDWLCEAALDTYLPLVEQLRRLERDQVPAPVTIGFTPVLANQLASPAFGAELEAFFDQRLAACAEAPASLASTGDQTLLPLVTYWRERFERLRQVFRSTDGNLLGEFRALRERGALEIIGSAATHGYLPLLRRDESIRLQLGVGYQEHTRLLGAAPVGCWLPECAYRPARGARPGIETHLAEAGFRYCFVDAHLASAGMPLGSYGDVPLGAERFDAERREGTREPAVKASRTPYAPYRISRARPGVTALVRDPRSSMQVWSRQQGYPGDESYLEFHKIRWPGGLKLWRVTGGNVDLGDKQAYEPERARHKTSDHARHFADLLSSIAGEKAPLVVAPFDTELFGHWWFEGPRFVGEVLDLCARAGGISAVPAGTMLERQPPRERVALPEGSWGDGGGHQVWLNDATRWTWPLVYAAEGRFGSLASTAAAREPVATTEPLLERLLNQAGRELLLLESSDWQFLITTFAARDYAELRVTEHAEAFERLADLAERRTQGGSLSEADENFLTECERRDSLFPDFDWRGYAGDPASARVGAR
jgi:1,4-alpha-glucan branching enzyme